MTINKMVIDRWSDNCTRGEWTARRHRLGQTIPEDIADSLQKVVALWIDKRADEDDQEKTNGQGVDKKVRGGTMSEHQRHKQNENTPDNKTGEEIPENKENNMDGKRQEKITT